MPTISITVTDAQATKITTVAKVNGFATGLELVKNLVKGAVSAYNDQSEARKARLTAQTTTDTEMSGL